MFTWFASLWAKIKWGISAGACVDETGRKLVYACNYSPDSFVGNTPWGTGRTWREAFRNASSAFRKLGS